MKILHCDTETSGLIPGKYGIISLAFLVEQNNKIIDEGYWEMMPSGKVCSKEALDINGYSMDQLRSFRPWEQVFQDVLSFLDNHVDRFDSKDKFVLSGYNVDFDYRHLKAFFEYCGNDYIFSYIHGLFLDVFKLIPFLQYQGKMPVLANNKLQTVCDYFKVKLDGAHNSLVDIKATRELLLKMKEL